MQASCCSTLTCITICHEYALRDCTMSQTASMLKAPGCCKVSKEYVLVPTQFDCCCFMFHFLYVGSLLKCCDGSWLWQWWHSLAPAAAWKVGKVRKQLRLFCSRIATLCLNCLCCQLFFCNSRKIASTPWLNSFPAWKIFVEKDDYIIQFSTPWCQHFYWPQKQKLATELLELFKLLKLAAAVIESVTPQMPAAQ